MARISDVTRWQSAHSTVRGAFADDLLQEGPISDSFEEFKSILEEIGKKVSTAGKPRKGAKPKHEAAPISDGDEGELHILPIENPVREAPVPKAQLELRQHSQLNGDEKNKLDQSEKESSKSATDKKDQIESKGSDSSDKTDNAQSNDNSDSSREENQNDTGTSQVDESSTEPKIESETSVEVIATAASTQNGEKTEKTFDEMPLFDDSKMSEALLAENNSTNSGEADPEHLTGQELTAQPNTQIAEPLLGTLNGEIVAPTSEGPIVTPDAMGGTSTEVVPVPHAAQAVVTDQVMEYAPQEPMAKETFELIEQALRSIFEERSKVVDSTKAQLNPLAPGFVNQELLGSNNGNSAVLRALLTGSNDNALAKPLSSINAENLKGNAGTPQVSALSETVRPGSRGAENSQARASRPLPRALESRTLEKVENALKEVVKSRDGKTISFRLDPPSLGTVKIDVSYRDGSLHAKISPEASQVGNFLRERAYELVGVLRKLGLNVEKITVSILNFEMTSQDFDSGFSSGSNANEGRSSGENGQRLRDDILPEDFGNTAQESGDAIREQQPLDHWVA